MNNIEVKVPQLVESVTEATLLEWKKKVNEIVLENDIIATLETDKVVLDIPSPNSGVLIKCLKNVGDIVKSNDVIALIDKDKEFIELDSKFENKKSELPDESSVKNIILSPAAKKIVREKNISDKNLMNIFNKNRINKQDIILNIDKLKKDISFISNKETKKTDLVSDINVNSLENKFKDEYRVPMSKLRINIANRLLSSQKTNAILTTFNEVNMNEVFKLRIKYKDKFEKLYNTKIGFMSFFVKASIFALKKFSIINASVDNNEIVYHNYFNIGIAISSNRGLVVPVLCNVDKMSFIDIEKNILYFIDKANNNKLSIEDMSCGTFSISNGGVFGSLLSTPIINPPQSAILGIHSIKERPIVEDNKIVIRPMVYLALSYDHRIIDGKEAILFLREIKEILEDPICLLFN